MGLVWAGQRFFDTCAGFTLSPECVKSQSLFFSRLEARFRLISSLVNGAQLKPDS